MKSKDVAADGGLKPPGSGASSCMGYTLWNSLFDCLNSGRSRLSKIWFSIKANRAQERAPERSLWPVPIPFPELHRRRANRAQRDGARKLSLNFIILILNFLTFPDRHWAKVVPPLGTPLNGRQWGAVRSMMKHVDAWNDEEEITSEAMGRSAAKVQNVEELLGHLHRWTEEAGLVADKYKSRQGASMQTSWGHQANPGEVVGSVDEVPSQLAQALVPERLKFWDVPSFKAEDYMDEANRAVYLDPLAFALPPDLEQRPPPRVKVRVSHRKKVALLHKLDSVKRLALVPASSVRTGYESGLFSIPKDSERDRMVMDARPANCLEINDDVWVKTLGSLVQLQHFFLDHTRTFIFLQKILENITTRL